MNFLNRTVAQVRTTLDEYPRPFWTLIGASFIDNLGGALLFPFFTLYVTAKFGVGMTTVGLLFALFSLASVVGSTVGGALTDRLGRKKMLIFGLLASASTVLVMGLADTIALFAVGAVLAGLFANTGQPAQQAMVADLLPKHQRTEGYGIQRVIQNLAVIFGPVIGGFMAAISYLLLFVTDAIASTITATIVFFKLPETKPEATEDEGERESMAQTFRGYSVPLKDLPFQAFLLASALATIVYMQMHTTLAVYLRDLYDVPPQGYAALLSMNALIVVLLQFPTTRSIKRFSPMLMMAAGTLLYAIGFGLFGVASGYVMFIIAMLIITTGEMLVVPVSQALVASMSPEAMRGRYMAMYDFSWVIPMAVGPLLAGLIMDNADPRWVWYASLLVGLLSTGIYLLLLKRGIPRSTEPAK
jgi:MFS family permease